MTKNKSLRYIPLLIVSVLAVGLGIVASTVTVPLNPGDNALVSCINSVQVTKQPRLVNVICATAITRTSTSTRIPTKTKTSAPSTNTVTAIPNPSGTPSQTPVPTDTPSFTNTPTPVQVSASPSPTSFIPPSPTPTTVVGVNSFLETFTGVPIMPMPWQPSNWDVTVHTRDMINPDTLTSMRADHGAQCEPPPATHPVSNYPSAVFICANHLMTAINEGGYGVIYLTPNDMVDFSTGTATIKFDVSTLRKSGRDWIDLWVTPFYDNLQLPLQSFFPDLVGPPKRSVHIVMREGFPTSFGAEVYRDFDTNTQTIMGTWWVSEEEYLTPSAATRTTFELDLSQNHIKFGMPQYNFWWIDQDIPNLDWNQGVVQIGHHSYNPEKFCNFDGTCGPTTWHWDNVSIAPAVPFNIIRSTELYATATSGGQANFPSPAPANAFLRFSGIGNSIDVSFDGGATWSTARTQIQERTQPDHFMSYWMPIPEGVFQVKFRGHDWYNGIWQARDLSIWSK